jgi:antitoxin ParD1/3/4
MANASLNISLPEALKEYVKERVAEESFGTPSDYVRSLIRDDKKRRDRERLDQLLLEGLRSDVEAITPEYLEELRREVSERTSRKHKPGA